MKIILLNEMKAIYHPDDWNYTDWLFSREGFNLDFIETLLMDDFKYQSNGSTTFRLHGSNKKDFYSIRGLNYG